MKHIITKSGFECDVNPEIAKDYRTLRVVADMEDDELDGEEKFKSVMRFIPIIIGRDGEKKLIKHVMADGVVDATKMMAEAKEILLLLREEPETKNS